MAAHDWTSALERCEAEYARSKDLARAVDAATAAFYLDRLDDVVRLANLALTGATSADAHYLLGSAALRRGDHSAAISHLETAVKLHGEIGAARAESRDYHQLAGTRYQLGEYQAAQRAEVAGRDAAERAHDLRMMVYLDIARADIQRRIGDLPGAEASIERALREASVPDDRATALLKRGALHLDQNHPGLARDPLVQALAIEQAGSKREDILQALHLDLAYVERKAKAFARALDEIEQARVAGTDAMSYHLNRGLVYADMGRLDDANTDFVAAETERLDGTWAWWAPFQRAQVAARQGTLETAIAEDLRAIKQVARLASNAGALGPTVIASHREPYLHLLGLFARQEQWNAVLDVVAAMDSRLLLASREQATDPAPGGDLAAPMRAQGAAIVAGAGLRAVAAWQGRPLAIVVPGGDQILRIDVRDGAVTGTDVGAAGPLADLARQLENDPDDLEAGRVLGRAMLPAQPPPRGTPLALLVVGPLARAPLAGLRIGDERASGRTSLVRAAGFLPRGPVTLASGAPIAIGDPNGDLPAAADEARRVAKRLGATVLIGAEATRAAFAQISGARLAHIAAHTMQRRGGATRAELALADGAVDAEAIARLSPPPRVVVLASCGGSSGRDDASNGSLTSAFLDAGAEIAIGTRWSVDDAEAAQFVESFYAAGGDRDPIAALAATQLGSTTSARTRAAFEAIVARPVR